MRQDGTVSLRAQMKGNLAKLSQNDATKKSGGEPSTLSPKHRHLTLSQAKNRRETRLTTLRNQPFGVGPSNAQLNLTGNKIATPEAIGKPEDVATFANISHIEEPPEGVFTNHPPLTLEAIGLLLKSELHAFKKEKREEDSAILMRIEELGNKQDNLSLQQIDLQSQIASTFQAIKADIMKQVRAEIASTANALAIVQKVQAVQQVATKDSAETLVRLGGSMELIRAEMDSCTSELKDLRDKVAASQTLQTADMDTANNLIVFGMRSDAMDSPAAAVSWLRAHLVLDPELNFQLTAASRFGRNPDPHRQPIKLTFDTAANRNLILSAAKQPWSNRPDVDVDGSVSIAPDRTEVQRLRAQLNRHVRGGPRAKGQRSKPHGPSRSTARTLSRTTPQPNVTTTNGSTSNKSEQPLNGKNARPDRNYRKGDSHYRVQNSKGRGRRNST